MRWPLVFGVMFAPCVTSACTFEAFSIDQVRTAQILFQAYRDGLLIDELSVDRLFSVDYDGQIVFRDGIPRVTNFKLRPLELLIDEVVRWEVDGAFEARLRIHDSFGYPEGIALDGIQLQSSAYTLPGVPPMELGLGTGSYVDLGTGFQLPPTVHQTANGWSVNAVGPSYRYDSPGSRVVRQIRVPGHEYEITAAGVTWIDAEIPLTALTPPDFVCNGDFNGNGQVEQGDLDLVLLNWGQRSVPVEWTNNLPTGTIDQDELDGVLLHWGDVSPVPLGAASAPEPSAAFLVLVAIAFFAALTRRPNRQC